MRVKLILFSLICLFAAVLMIAGKVEAQRLVEQRIEAQRVEAPGYEIRLKSRGFTPPEGIVSAIASYINPSAYERVHVLMQFGDIPNAAQRQILKASGVSLLNYIPHKAWLVSVPRGLIPAQLRGANVRWIGPILAEDKISLAVKNKNYVKNDDGTINLSIKFFSDLDLYAASLTIENYGQIGDKYLLVNTVKLITEERFIPDIADEENVQWIDVIDKILQRHNDGNRANIGVDTLQSSPYNLSGSGVVISEWDGGWADTTHDDLQGRVIIGDTGSSVDDHATHVAGTMLGNGTLSVNEGGTDLQWRGMAPQATLISFEWWDDSTELNNEYGTAITTYDTSLSQNSWGYEYRNCRNDCFGGYDSSAGELDGIVRGSIGNKRISQIWSAGNSRPNCDNGNYDCIGFPGTAKNAITVGATNSNDDSMTSFSSWGPTNDGRLKPEVSAPGCQVGGDGGVTSTFPADTYGVFCGTSMAAPTTSGVVALMLEEFASDAIYPLPSTIKAILIHTALDLGNVGPDYSFGYGRIDALAAIEKIKAESYVEDEAGHGLTDTYTLNVPSGATEVKITLVWDDEPAAPNADPALVNDLDLIVRDPDNTRHYPWTLNPSSPSDSAVQTQEDHTNNAEQVVVNTSLISGDWTIEVYGNNVPSAPQRYSLVFTPNYGANVIGKIYEDSGYTQEEKFFNRTNPVYIQAYVTAAGTTVTGAVVNADLRLSDNTLVTTLLLTDVGGGYYQNSWNSTGQTPDVYSVDIRVDDLSLTTRKYFHLYPQSGVSSYRLDFDEDGNDDYILENKHLIAVYDGRVDSDKLLLYLYQKDTDAKYNFAEISDADSIGRGEITSSKIKKIKFSSFSLGSGENLPSSTFGLVINLTKELFSDGFESGDFATGGWSLDSPPPDINTEDVYEGIYSAGKKVYGGYGGNYHRMWRTVDTTGNTNIAFSYARAVQDAGAGTVTFTAEYSINGGLTWFELESVTDTNDVFTYVSWPLPAGAENNPNFVIRFGGIFGGGNSSSANDWWVDDVKVTSDQLESKIETQFNIAIEMKTQEVDYLVYKLSNFDEFIDDINDIFSPISGSLGLSIDDDRYHIGDGTDNLITSLSSGTWTNFSALTDAQKYIAIYDDSNSSDAVNDNVISWVYFPPAATVSFQNVGLWYETGKEALRLRYDTTSATGTNQAEYILAFTQGDYSVIDQWMSMIAGGTLPSPNFISPPSALSVSVLPTGWSIGEVTEGQVSQSSLFTVTNDGSIIETFTLNIEGPSSPSGWLTASAPGYEVYTMKGLFGGTGDNPTGLFSGDDVIIIGSPSAATDIHFGDSSLTLDGVSVEVNGERGLWFQFQAPTSTSSGGEEQSITVSVGAQVP